MSEFDFVTKTYHNYRNIAVLYLWFGDEGQKHAVKLSLMKLEYTTTKQSQSNEQSYQLGSGWFCVQ